MFAVLHRAWVSCYKRGFECGLHRWFIRKCRKLTYYLLFLRVKHENNKRSFYSIFRPLVTLMHCAVLCWTNKNFNIFERFCKNCIYFIHSHYTWLKPEVLNIRNCGLCCSHFRVRNPLLIFTIKPKYNRGQWILGFDQSSISFQDYIISTHFGHLQELLVRLTA